MIGANFLKNIVFELGKKDRTMKTGSKEMGNNILGGKQARMTFLCNG